MKRLSWKQGAFIFNMTMFLVTMNLAAGIISQTGTFTVQRVDLTEAEKTANLDGFSSLEEKATARKLEKIKNLRLARLQKTDWMSYSDVTMPSYIKTWRQTLRDLPQNNTTDSQYNTLLAKDSNGNLTNSVWTQPTS